MSSENEEQRKNATTYTEYSVSIEGLDLAKPVVFPISPGTPYHSNGSVTALLKFIEQQECEAILPIADRALTLQIEDSTLTSEIAAKKADLTVENWIRTQITEIPENKLIYDRLVQNNKIKVCSIKTFDKECTQKYQEINHKEYAETINTNDESFSKALNIASDNYAETASKKTNCPLFVGKEKAKELSSQYIINESNSMLLWVNVGYTQIGYPITNNGNENNNNLKIFNCVRAAFKQHRKNDDAKLLDIKIKKNLKNQLTSTHNLKPTEQKNLLQPPSFTKSSFGFYVPATNNAGAGSSVLINESTDIIARNLEKLLESIKGETSPEIVSLKTYAVSQFTAHTLNTLYQLHANDSNNSSNNRKISINIPLIPFEQQLNTTATTNSPPGMY